MDPVDALERVAYLLDRHLAGRRRIAAYVRAAGIVRSTAPATLARLSAEGRLTDLPGIGPSTARVVTEALAGATPATLARLELETRLPAGPGAELRRSLRGDCHTHSTWSDGGASIRAMALAARALGHDYLVVTDHSGGLTVANGLDETRLLAQLDEIGGLNEELAPFRILSGMEVDILADGSLDLSAELLARLDVVVASAHSKLRLEPDAMTRRLVRAVANPHTDILGHCTNRKLAGVGDGRFVASGVARAPSGFDAEIVFAACARFGTAVEINCRPERQDPPDDLLAMALEWGCRFAIDSDAHAPGQLEWGLSWPWVRQGVRSGASDGPRGFRGGRRWSWPSAGRALQGSG
jgi:putative hydrolase